MLKPIFQSSQLLFDRRALPQLASSDEYSAIDFRLEKLLVLADRLLAACDGHPLHGRVPGEISRRLGNLMKAVESGADASHATVDLLAKLEIWLKAILWLALPDKWEKAQQNSQEAKAAGKPSRFNLYQVIQDLGLLSEEEIQTPVDRFSDIQDGVRQLILCAKEDRNPLEHDGSEIPHHVRGRLLDSALVAFLAPVIRYQKELQSGLRCLVVKPLEFGSLNPLARQVESERRGHLDRFAGREEWLTSLSDKLSDQFCDEGGYILLTATEGTGKSAIVSKLSQQFVNEASILGAHSTQVQKFAPWVPAVILHMGKASNLPSEIVPFLLEQIRCQLVSPLPDFGSIFPETITQDSIDQQVRRLGREDSILHAKDRNLSDTEETPYLADLGKESSVRSSGYLHARRFLFDSLEKLVTETGRVILLIDALEEISNDGSRLAFLPERLPPGVACLLTSRPQTAAEHFVRAKLKNVDPIELKQLRREELPLLTNVDDNTPGGREFNNEVMENSSGLPLIVSGIGRHVTKESDFTKVQVQGVRDRHFELKAKEWSESGKINKDALGLLAIFEPVMPLELADLQAYLASQSEFFEVAEIRDALKPVSAQLQGLDVSRVKLAMRPFAEYVREKYFSPRDLFIRFKRAVDWLLEDDEVKPDVFARLFMVWSNANALSENQSELSKKHQKLLSDLPAILLEQKRDELLFQSASRILKESEEINSTAIECLRYASQLGSLDAMRMFSNLIDGDVDDVVKREAVDWVKSGAEKGDAASMMIIGNRLIDGTGVEQDASTGFNWLERSAQAGHVRAMMSLGMRLVYEDGLEKNVLMGLDWLKKASDNGLPTANFVLGQLLLDGEETDRDVNAGLSHLENAIETGFIPAIRFLSSRFLKGTGVPKNTERGIQLLQQAVALDDETATLALAHRSFTGNGIARSEENGLAILEAGVSKGQTLAKRVLGFELLTGANITDTDSERGIALLEEASEVDDAPSMELLADYLLDKTDDGAQKGEALLRKAIELGYDAAVSNLANRWAKGKGLPKDLKKGLTLLRKYAEAERVQVRWELGRALIEGRFGKRNTDEGVEILEALCQEGDVPAKRYLGLEFLDGNNIPADSARGIAHLESAVSGGDTDAMIALGRYLIDSSDSVESRAEGLRLILRAEEAGDIEASFELGKLYLDGKAVERDVERAFQYIRDAAIQNYVPAMIYLAKECVSGTNINKDEQEADRLLSGVGKRDSLSLVLAGYEFYRSGQNYWAAWCFLSAFKSGTSIAGNNLAYMVRRGEAPKELSIPNPLALLSKGAKEGDAYCLVNQALCVAAGVGSKVDWNRADQSMAKVPTLESLRSDATEADAPEHPVDWWLSLTKEPPHSSEGHLVIGWLVRHGKVDDPEGMQPSERFRLAREGGWDVPDNFFE